MEIGATSLLLFLQLILILTSISQAVYLPSFVHVPSNDTDGSYVATSSAALLGPILANLGFEEMASAIPALSETAWNGPTTVFAPSDESVRSCTSCSADSLLLEHSVPGLFSLDHLSKLAFGTKIQTLSPDRCLTVTSSTISAGVKNSTKIFINGVEITRPDLFNDVLVIVHGIHGFVSPLSPYSCRKDPYVRQGTAQPPLSSSSFVPPISIVRLMLRDAMVRLRSDGYSIVSLALRLKYAELANLHNMTIFALDDDAIFAGGHAYVANVRFHIVPNRFLMQADLLRMPVGTTLETLVEGQSLVVTSSGPGLRINYIPIRSPDVMLNLKIVVHSIFLPFPHLLPPHTPVTVSMSSLRDTTCAASDSDACAASSPTWSFFAAEQPAVFADEFL